MATIGEQHAIAFELGRAIATPGTQQLTVATRLGESVTQLGVDPVDIPLWPVIDSIFGESQEPYRPAARDTLFVGAVMVATNGILTRESATFEPDRARASAHHLRGLVDGTAAADFDPRVTHKLVRKAISRAMEPLEGRGSYTAIGDVAHLQTVMDVGEFGNLGTTLHHVGRRLRAIQAYGTDVYGRHE